MPTGKQTYSGLLETLAERFEQNAARHSHVEWSEVEKRLSRRTGKLRSLSEMERTGGEPDVIGGKAAGGEILFVDCSQESPKGRRSLCYDEDARAARKKHKPAGSALQMATDMGAQLLTEAQYQTLQEFGPFDLKTSSWLLTPADVRELGGAIFGDCRYDRVFTYHNGAESYYAARGFRCSLLV